MRVVRLYSPLSLWRPSDTLRRRSCCRPTVDVRRSAPDTRVQFGEAFTETSWVEYGDLIGEVEEVLVPADEDRLSRGGKSNQVVVPGVCRLDGRRPARVFDHGRGFSEPVHDPLGLTF